MSFLLLHLNFFFFDQGIVAFHLGRDKEAKLLLEKVTFEMQLLAVDEVDLMEIVR